MSAEDPLLRFDPDGAVGRVSWHDAVNCACVRLESLTYLFDVGAGECAILYNACQGGVEMTFEPTGGLIPTSRRDSP